MTISWSTRKNVIDWLTVERVAWSGRLDEVAFLSRLFDLEELPSYDYRYHTAYDDIRQHRVNNNDGDDDWVFSDDRFGIMRGDDETFLRFLSEMVHPVVRPDPTEAEELASQLSDLLEPDGFELVRTTNVGKHPVWTARRRTMAGSQALPAVRRARAAFSADYVSQQITRMDAAVDSDPALAVGTAKELLETTCKAILEAREKVAPKSADLPKLVRLVAQELRLVPEDVPQSAKASESVRQVLGALGSVVTGVAELRNAYGTGHGQAPTRGGLSPRHAKLVVGAASTVAVFLYETHAHLVDQAHEGSAKSRVSRG